MFAENLKIKGEVRDCIGCRYRAEDDVDIAEHRGPWRIAGV